MSGKAAGATSLPWLEKHVKSLKMLETVRRLRETHVYLPDEIIRVVGERYRRIKRRRPGLYGRIELELKRLEVVFNVVYSRLRRVAQMPLTSEMSDFHRILVEMFVGDSYDKAVRRIRKSLRLIRRLWNEYRILVVSAESSAEAARLRREGAGRILSVVRRLRRELELLSKVRVELLKTHVVSEGLPVIVVAGIPSAGKSTLIKLVSTAEPQVAPYPFTTKSIIVGKAEHDSIKFYLVDTPGVLERPAEQHNEIERKALAALKALPDIVLFLIDPSPEKLQPVEAQLRLLKSIYDNIIVSRDAQLIIAINKADVTPADQLSETLREVETFIKENIDKARLCTDGVKVVSALSGKGVDQLLKDIVECVKSRTPWLKL